MLLSGLSSLPYTSPSSVVKAKRKKNIPASGLETYLRLELFFRQVCGSGGDTIVVAVVVVVEWCRSRLRESDIDVLTRDKETKYLLSSQSNTGTPHREVKKKAIVF